MYKALTEMIKQIEKCNFQCEGGFLKNNQSWIDLKKEIRHIYKKAIKDDQKMIARSLRKARKILSEQEESL